MEEIMKSGVQYVYVYWIDGIPRYVGNGRGKRILDHISSGKSTNKQLKEMILSSLDVKYEIVAYGSQEEVDEKERELIQKYGRLVNESGTLCNRLSGGKSEFKIDKETKKKISDSHIGKLVSSETKKKISDSLIGIEGSMKNKFALSHVKTKQKYQQLHPITREVIAEFIGNYALKEAGFNQGHCNSCANGKHKHHKGYSWKIVQI